MHTYTSYITQINVLFVCSDKVKELHEMFPKASGDHIAKCLRQANGHMDTAVELLLACCQVC